MLPRLRPCMLKRLPKIPSESPSRASVQSVTWSSTRATKRSAIVKPPAETMCTRSALRVGSKHSRERITKLVAPIVVMTGSANGCTSRDDGHRNQWYFKGARCKDSLCFNNDISTKTSLTFRITGYHFVISPTDGSERLSTDTLDYAKHRATLLPVSVSSHSAWISLYLDVHCVPKFTTTIFSFFRGSLSLCLRSCFSTRHYQGLVTAQVPELFNIITNVNLSIRHS